MLYEVITRISEFAHEVESILAALRDGKIGLSPALISHTLLSRDIIKDMIESGEPEGDSLSPELSRITSYNVCYTKLLRPAPVFVRA